MYISLDIVHVEESYDEETETADQFATGRILDIYCTMPAVSFGLQGKNAQKRLSAIFCTMFQISIKESIR